MMLCNNKTTPTNYFFSLKTYIVKSEAIASVAITSNAFVKASFNSCKAEISNIKKTAITAQIKIAITTNILKILKTLLFFIHTF